MAAFVFHPSFLNHIFGLPASGYSKSVTHFGPRPVVHALWPLISRFEISIFLVAYNSYIFYDHSVMILICVSTLRSWAVLEHSATKVSGTRPGLWEKRAMGVRCEWVV